MKTLTNMAAILLLTISSMASANDLPDYPRVVMETSEGMVTMELFNKRAPLSVANFIEHVNSGYYEDVAFHRVIAGFVIQAGGFDKEYAPKQQGKKKIPNESGNGLSNRRGTVAMARTAEPHSANSQFYINLGDNPPLDPRPTRWGYTVFGRVIEGMDVVDAIGYAPTGPGPGPALSKDVPTKPVYITKMYVVDEAADESAATADE